MTREKRVPTEKQLAARKRAEAKASDGSTWGDYHDRCSWKDLFGKYLLLIEDDEDILHEAAMSLSEHFNIAEVNQIVNLATEYRMEREGSRG